MKSQKYAVVGIVLSILFVDQIVKILVKTNMYLGESIPVFGNWFLISFTENPGMAFGMEFGGEFGKLILSLFRITLVIFIGIFISRLIKKKNINMGVLTGLALIMAGALGNIIDSLFYGIIFNSPYPPEIASIFSPEGGYARFLHGYVVDMLYFPIIETSWPSWVPAIGGKEFTFFRPVFNIADSAISIGVIYLLLFQRKFFLKKTS